MGQDKALLSVGDVTLLELMQSKLAATTLFDEIVICRNQSCISDPDIYLPDIHPGLGPIGALHTLSTHYPNHRALVVPVDMPLLEVASIKKLCKVSKEHRGAVNFAQHNLPLVIYFDKNTNFYLNECVNNEDADLSINQLLCDINARQLTPPKDLVSFTNVNTLQDWQDLLR